MNSWAFFLALKFHEVFKNNWNFRRAHVCCIYFYLCYPIYLIYICIYAICILDCGPVICSGEEYWNHSVKNEVHHSHGSPPRFSQSTFPLKSAHRISPWNSHFFYRWVMEWDTTLCVILQTFVCYLYIFYLSIYLYLCYLQNSFSQ